MSLRPYLNACLCERTWVSRHLPFLLVKPLRFCRKSVIRGALTNEQVWIFLILRMNSDGNGAIYAESTLPWSQGAMVITKFLAPCVIQSLELSHIGQVRSIS